MDAQYPGGGMQIGDRLEYPGADIDSREWDDGVAALRKADKQLYDDGDGYVVAWLFARDGSRLEANLVYPCPYLGEQPETAEG